MLLVSLLKQIQYFLKRRNSICITCESKGAAMCEVEQMKIICLSNEVWQWCFLLSQLSNLSTKSLLEGSMLKTIS